jgi:hypothetical protein
VFNAIDKGGRDAIGRTRADAGMAECLMLQTVAAAMLLGAPADIMTSAKNLM